MFGERALFPPKSNQCRKCKTKAGVAWNREHYVRRRPAGPLTHRTCRHCGYQGEIKEFRANTNNCLPCDKAQMSARYRMNHAQRRVDAKARYAANREKVLAAMSTPEAREKINAQRRTFYAKNKQAVFNRLRGYREKNKDRFRTLKKGQTARYYAAHKVDILEKTKAWARANPQKVAERARRYVKRHPDKAAAAQKKYYTSPKGLLRATVANHRRRAAKRKVESTVTRSQIAELKMRSRGICHYCGKKTSRPTIDHVIPITRAGANSLHNLVVACLSCNSSKNDTPPEEYARRIGLLLI